MEAWRAAAIATFVTDLPDRVPAAAEAARQAGRPSDQRPGRVSSQL
jgi:hypothetical protein